MKLIQTKPNKPVLLLNEEECNLLREVKIPGLFVWKSNKGAWGEIGAVAAGCRLLKGETPKVLSGNHFGEYSELLIENLRSYQTYGVDTLCRRLRVLTAGILADDMGLGKTRQALTITSYFSGRKLILCPASVRLQWVKELKLLFPNETYLLIDPYAHSKLKKGKLTGLDADYIITSYDLAEKVYERCFAQSPPEILVLDEAHNLRGRGLDGKGNVRTSGIRTLARAINYKLAITGTPIWDRPKDLWMLWDILGIKVRRWDFDVRYCNGNINAFGGMDNHGASNEEELKLRLSYYTVRRTKKEVAKELPPLTRTVEWLDPVESCTKAMQSATMTPGASSLSNALLATHEAKLARAIELAVQAQQFILFTYRKEHARYLCEAINAQGVKCVAITGEDSPNVRNRLIEQARTNQHGVVATIDSVGTGVNMQNIATTGIMHALAWEPNKMLQAEARPHRIDTHEPFNWIYLAVRESADEHVINTVVNKLEVWQNIMGMTESDKGLKDALSDSRSVEVERAVMKELFDSMEISE